MNSCSVIIIAYNSRNFLPACLQSVTKALQNLNSEIIVLDNGSEEPIGETEKKYFSNVRWLHSDENLGFGKGCNLAAAQATKSHLFFINPDTIISENAFEKMLAFMQEHVDAGIVGCRILNEDGSLQYACRRSFPSPLSAVFKTFGLAKLFPRSRFFASYNMTYLDPDATVEVDAVSGSFFCIRRELFEQIGGFDKDYFMYAEDLDLCLRVQKAGYKNYYAPVANILHFKGQSSKTRRFRSYIDFYSAMLIFAKKHRRFHLPYVLVALGIFLAALLGVFSRLLPQCWKILPDVCVFGLIALGIHFDFGALADSFPVFTSLHTDLPFFSFFFGEILLLLLLSGEYASSNMSLKNALIPLGLGSIVFLLVSVFFGKSILPIVALMGVTLLLLFIWRRIAYWTYYFYRIFAKKRHRAILLGGRVDSLKCWFNRYRLIPGIEILGCVTNEPEKISEENRMFMLGSSNEIGEICRRSGCRELWVQSNEDGSHEEYRIKELLNLGLKVYLLIGNIQKRDFALVNLQYLK